MIIDDYKLVVFEQSPFPGSIGDSCAETARFVLLQVFNGSEVTYSLKFLVTDKGLIRHPESPWREDDTSGDQTYPFIAAAHFVAPDLAAKVIADIKAAGYRTGNGDLASPGLRAQMAKAEGRHSWVNDLPLLAQALVLKLPYRWSDSKKKFESTEGNSGDYLNLINGMIFSEMKGSSWVNRLTKKLVSKEMMFERVGMYYAPEPNANELSLEYEKALDKLYAKTL